MNKLNAYRNLEREQELLQFGQDFGAMDYKEIPLAPQTLIEQNLEKGDLQKLARAGLGSAFQSLRDLHKGWREDDPSVMADADLVRGASILSPIEALNQQSYSTYAITHIKTTDDISEQKHMSLMSHSNRQGESHFSDEIAYSYENILLKFVILPAVLAVSTAVIAFCFLLLNRFMPEWCKSYRWLPSTKTTYVILGITVILICIFAFIYFCVPFKNTIFFVDYNKQLQKEFPVFVYGTWVTIYDAGSTRLWKIISVPGVSHNDFNHVNLPTINKYCHPSACTIPVMIAHVISTTAMLITWKRIFSLQKEDDPIQKFFPIIYELNIERKAILTEKIPHQLQSNCPFNYADQIKEMNKHLQRLGLYLDDIHHRNIMVDNNKQLKFIDGELYTDTEFIRKNNILKSRDTSQAEPGSYEGADRIIFWTDGRQTGDDICRKDIS